MKYKKFLIPLGLILGFLTIGSIFRNYLTDEYSEKAQKNLADIPPNTRLLVVAPHSDDETLGSGGLIQKVVKTQGTVKVVVLTNGDRSRSIPQKIFQTKDVKPNEAIQLSHKRYQESIAAMQKLGVTKQDVLFLGYPDGGTVSMWEKNWEISKPYTDNLTKLNKNPYQFSYRPDAAYAGTNEARDLETIIKEFKPTLVIYPHPDDHHPDHWVSYAYVKDTLLRSKLTKKPKELTYLVHYSGWPAPLGFKPSADLNPPRSLEEGGNDWLNLPLSKLEIQKKTEAIQSYRTQIEHSQEFLDSFSRKNELYCTAPVSNLSANAGTTTLPNPESDYLFRFLQSIGGIKGISIQKKDTDVILNCQTKMMLNPLYKYVTSLTIFSKNNPPEKINIVITNGQIKTSYDNDQLNSKRAIKVTLQKHSIVTKLDYPTQEPLYLLISARIEARNKTIDSTAWKMVRIN